MDTARKDHAVLITIQKYLLIKIFNKLKFYSVIYQSKCLRSTFATAAGSSDTK